MEKQKLIFGFKDNKIEYSFENKVFVISDKTLLENISKPSIKNQNSSLIIKSLNDTSVADVIQIKINVAETGHFLVSFEKNSLSDEKREELLKEIGHLKSEETPSAESQLKKILELLGILSKNSPIYCTFANTGDIKIEPSLMEKIQIDFPLLVLEKPRKRFSIQIGRPRDQKQPSKNKKEVSKKALLNNKEKEKIKYQPFDLFDIDYFFVFVFSLLGSFAITAAIFELMNKKGLAAFLIVLAVVFAITLVIAVYSTVYKKGKLKNPWLRYYLAIFILLGITGGIVSGYFICKGILKTDIEDFNYKRLILISILISIVSLLSSVESSRLVNIFIKKRLNKKSH